MSKEEGMVAASKAFGLLEKCRSIPLAFVRIAGAQLDLIHSPAYLPSACPPANLAACMTT